MHRSLKKSLCCILFMCSFGVNLPALAQEENLTQSQKEEIEKVCNLGLFEKALRGASYAGSALTEALPIAGFILDISDKITGEREIKEHINRDYDGVTYSFHFFGGVFSTVGSAIGATVFSLGDFLTGDWDEAKLHWTEDLPAIERIIWGRTGGLSEKYKKDIEECRSTVLDYMNTREGIERKNDILASIKSPNKLSSFTKIPHLKKLEELRKNLSAY